MSTRPAGLPHPWGAISYHKVAPITYSLGVGGGWCSEGKAEMSAVVLEQALTDGSIPAALVTGNVCWVMDAAAASKLTR